MRHLIALAAMFIVLPLAVADAKPTRAQAEHALSVVRGLQKGQGVKTGHELTPALNDLFKSLPSLGRDDRRAAEAILARPDDGQADAPGTHKWSGLEAVGSPKCTTHFCVHWTTAGGDASNATYAQDMADLFENQVYPCENGTSAAACAGAPGLGWRDPAGDGTRGGDARVDIYIEDLFSTEHVFGYVALDPGQSQDPAVPHFAYMVMDNDYTRFGDGSPASGVAAESVTAAHEYNHVLQNSYDFLEDTWMFEATAVYMEDKVYPAINDYLDYVKAWVANTRQPLTTFSDQNLKPYGSAVWNHWLDHRFGAGVIRSAWEQSVGAGDFAPAAYSSAIGPAGGGSFAEEFGRFAAAVAEWEAPGAGFPDSYPDLPRDGLLPTGTQTQPFALPHTTFSLFDVPVPASAPPVIRLTGTLPTGTAGAIALVGRTGSDPTGGTVTSNLTPMPSGGTAVVSLDNPAQFGRITALVVNADASRAGFDSSAGDWIFTRDAGDVALALAEPGPPIAETGAAGLISDHGAFAGAKIDPHLIDTTWSIEYGRTTAYGSKTTPQPVPATTVGSAAVTAPLGDLDANAVYHYRAVATNSAGSVTGADMTFRTARDVTKPVVSIVVKRQRQDRVRKSGLVYLVRCSERCIGSAQLIVSRRTARRLKLPKVLGKARLDVEARPRSTRLRVRLGHRANTRLRSVRRTFGVNLRVKAADVTGNSSRIDRRVSLLRSSH